MKNKTSSLLTGILTIVLLQFAVTTSLAQNGPIVGTNGNVVTINNFDTGSQVTNNGGFAWGNWFGTAYSNVVWSAQDASNNPSSGSMEIISFYPDSGIGGCCGSQFVVYAGNSPFNPPFAGNGTTLSVPTVTNFQCDIKIDPVSGTNANGTYPTIDFGTRGTNFGQYFFGSITIQGTNNNWVHVNIPVAANVQWTNIPNLFIHCFNNDAVMSNHVFVVYVDNLQFELGIPSNAPPVISIQKPTRSLRIFAGSTGLYDRQVLSSLDENQSWVGGSYPVSYSVTFSSYPQPTAINSNFVWHTFLIPVTPAGVAVSNNVYLDYNANNDLWLEINANPAAGGVGYVTANVAWKVGLPAANPNNTVLTITNPTAIGKWTLTFTGPTNGTLTAPGGTPQAFTINDPTIATDFGNPLISVWGIQPNSGWGQGQYCEVTHISTVGVASPGVPINDDFTSDTSINTNLWDLSNSVFVNSFALQTADSAWWLSWTYPDIGYALGTKSSLSGNIPWSTPAYYSSYTNTPFIALEANQVWSLIPFENLPSVDGTSNGVKAAQAFFREQKPAPAQ